MTTSGSVTPSDLPIGIGRPAFGALAADEATSLHDLTECRETELLRLHGVGPRAVSILREALAKSGLSLRVDR